MKETCLRTFVLDVEIVNCKLGMNIQLSSALHALGKLMPRHGVDHGGIWNDMENP